MTKEEKSELLKLAIESPPIDEQRAERAKFRLRATRDIKGLSYKEAVKLADEAEETLKHLPITDTAVEYFHNQRQSMLNYATNLAESTNSNNHEHEVLIHALVEFMDVVAQVQFYVPRTRLNSLQRRNAIESEIRTRLRLNSGMGYYVALGHAIDLIEL